MGSSGVGMVWFCRFRLKMSDLKFPDLFWNKRIPEMALEFAFGGEGEYRGEWGSGWAW